MSKSYAGYQGKIVESAKISLSPYDLGFLRGYAVFDVMLAQKDRPFLIKDHWQRLKKSAAILKLKVPLSFAAYQLLVKKLLILNNFSWANVRTILSGGFSSDGFTYQPGQETFLILIEKFQPYPAVAFENGVKVITHNYQRDLPRAKIANYVQAISRQRDKKLAGAKEIIYIKNNRALEASTSNLALVKKGKIISPKDDILLGITRKAVLSLARQQGFKVLEKPVTWSELLAADEMFLMATNKNVLPVVAVDGRPVGSGRVGPVTKELMRLFENFLSNY